MFIRILFLLPLLAPLVSAAQAQYNTPTAPRNGPLPSQNTGCPWLTQGSAAHALGGDVSVTVNVTNKGDGSCKFLRLSGSTDSLEILVSDAVLPTCPPDSVSLKGIGNAANSCRHPGPHGETVETISSRVRDRYFTVALASHQQKTSVKLDPQNDALEQVAEWVAGNLY